MGNIEMGFDLHMVFLFSCCRPSGEISKAASTSAKDIERLVGFYRAMTLTRIFDAKAIALQRTGKIGTFASALGQEAVGVGTASAMRPEDVLVPSYRDHAAQFLRGVTLTESALLGRRRARQRFARADFPICVPIGTQVPLMRSAPPTPSRRGEARACRHHRRWRHVEGRFLRSHEPGRRLGARRVHRQQ